MPQAEDPSAWRNFPKIRQPKRPAGRPRTHPVLNEFYGYPAEIIAEWCCVNRRTALAYKTGRLRPGKAAEKLFRLHRDRQILSSEWRGWLVKPDVIVDPEGNETSRSALRNYRLMLESFRDLARRSGDGKAMERYWAFLKVA